MLAEQRRSRLTACATTMLLGLTPGCSAVIGASKTDSLAPDAANTTAHPDASNSLPQADGGPIVVGAAGPFFNTPEFFNDIVSNVAPAANSAAMISSLANAGGWGNNNVMQIDFSIPIIVASPTSPMLPFTPNGDFSTPDCDQVAMPIPVGGNVEGETGYACPDGGDCHLLVSDPSNHSLYEMYEANLQGASLSAGCLVVWDTTKSYGADLRGDQCTSADAAGLPIAPLLFTADEVAAGHIDHAIRFILPNDRVQQNYVRPATHGTRSATGDSSAPNYGVHLRLRADYPLDSLPSDGARVVARAMQTYGMYHADGGNIALTAASDTYTTAKWDGLLGVHDLAALSVEDFEVIDHGPASPLTLDCVRN